MYQVVIHCCLLALIQVFGVSTAWSEQPLSAKATTVDGSESVGELVEWTTESVSLRLPTQVTEYPASELLRLEFQTPNETPGTTGMLVELVDGSRFPITSYEVVDHKATMATPFAAKSLTIPTEKIRYVVFPAEGIATESWLPAWQKKESTGDGLVLIKKSSGEVDFLSGVINDVSETEVNFTWEGDTIPVKRSKVAAISYYHSLPQELADPSCWLNLAQGYPLPVSGIVRDAELLQVTTTTGIPLQVPIAEIESADYSVGKLTYLSDLDPLRELFTPLIELPTSDPRVKLLGMPRRDTSFEGSPLTLAWPAEDDQEGKILKVYRKGLALRSRTELEYRIPRGMRRFVAIAGIDPETHAQGNVTLTITGDRQTLLDITISGNEPPVPIELDIAGKRRLEILVDYGANLDLGDRLHLVEARFIK